MSIKYTGLLTDYSRAQGHAPPRVRLAKIAPRACAALGSFGQNAPRYRALSRVRLAKRRVVHVQTLFSLWFCRLASFAEVGFVCGKCQRRLHTRTKPVSSAQDRRHNNLLTAHFKNKARRSKPHRALITVQKDVLLYMSPASFASKICSAVSSCSNAKSQHSAQNICGRRSPSR